MASSAEASAQRTSEAVRHIADVFNESSAITREIAGNIEQVSTSAAEEASRMARNPATEAQHIGEPASSAFNNHGLVMLPPSPTVMPKNRLRSNR